LSPEPERPARGAALRADRRGRSGRRPDASSGPSRARSLAAGPAGRPFRGPARGRPAAGPGRRPLRCGHGGPRRRPGRRRGGPGPRHRLRTGPLRDPRRPPRHRGHRARDPGRLQRGPRSLQGAPLPQRCGTAGRRPLPGGDGDRVRHRRAPPARFRWKRPRASWCATWPPPSLPSAPACGRRSKHDVPRSSPRRDPRRRPPLLARTRGTRFRRHGRGGRRPGGHRRDVPDRAPPAAAACWPRWSASAAPRRS
jgi:hypothetical protein